MSDIGPETISISTSESSDGARFRFAVNDLQAGFNEVGAGFDINACSLFDFGCMAGISISLKLHEFSFEMELINGGDYLAIVPQSVNLDFDLDIDPQYDGSICDAASFIVNEIESLLDIAGAGLEVLVDLASEFLGAINQLMGPLNVPIPEVTVPILEGNNLTFIPQMKELRSSSVELAASVSASFRGVLTTPDWRTGNYSVFSVVPDDTAVSPVLENQANFNVFDSGLNTLIRAVWYVVWATLATDQLAQGSELCEPSPGDPCPFPPFIAKHTGLQRILLRTVFPLSIGIFRSYRSSILLSPPSLKFETDIVSGSTSATIIVEGVRRNGEVVKLTDITAPVTVKGSLPDYDVESGKLSDLKITSFEIGELVPGDGRYRARPLFRLVRRAINGIVRLLVSRVNDAIDKELASQSLKLPTIKDFPLKDEGLSLLVDLLAVNLDAVAASATTSSFLNLDGSIAAAILTDSGARIAPPVFSKPTGFDSESLRLSVYDEMVGKAWTEQNSNKTYAFYYHREEDDIKTFTTIRYDEDSGEVLEKNGDSWVPLA